MGWGGRVGWRVGVASLETLRSEITESFISAPQICSSLAMPADVNCDDFSSQSTEVRPAALRGKALRQGGLPRWRPLSEITESHISTPQLCSSLTMLAGVNCDDFSSPST